MTCESLEQDVAYTKEKVDAGADFIITQLFYDVEAYFKYVQMCRDVGITVPIIPGIMPIQNYNGFKRMTGFCKTHVPPHILEALEPIQNDDASVKQYGIELGIEMCKDLLAKGAPGLHFYSLNLERSVVHILEGLGFVKQHGKKKLPWAPSNLSRRANEEVRPIFWANRPNSYLTRTTTWDEFPNGRWGDARSPAFGDLSDYHLCSFKTGSKAERRLIWGESISQRQDVYDVFVGYIQGSIPRLPWFEEPLKLETLPLKEQLIALNSSGFLTINSQPSINGVPSDDHAVGWGGPGGFIYQKAYLEFFTSPENLDRILALASKYPTLSYQAVNVRGEQKSNVDEGAKSVNAVTWGVFPGKEIIQPTVVDHNSFLVWKDEAFALWRSQWQSVYEPSSESFKTIGDVYENFYLVNVVENDFINGNIFNLFNELIA